MVRAMLSLGGSGSQRAGWEQATAVITPVWQAGSPSQASPPATHWEEEGGKLSPRGGNGAVKVDCKQKTWLSMSKWCPCQLGLHRLTSQRLWTAHPFTCSPWGSGPASRRPVRCTSVCLLPGGLWVGNVWGNDVYLIVFPWHKLPADFLLVF